MKTNETIKKILDDFDYQQIVFDSEYYKYLEFCSNQELENILNKINELVIVNYKEQIYSRQLKNNLYNILSVYRDMFKSTIILEKVNELLGILNVSDETKFGDFLINQFVNRYYNFYGLRFFYNIDIQNIFDYEDDIYKSINNDGSFLRGILLDDLTTFIKNNYSKYLPISNISYLICNYPKIFSYEHILDKIESLLITNVGSKLNPTDGEYMVDYTFEAINNKCLKDIKKITR